MHHRLATSTLVLACLLAAPVARAQDLSNAGTTAPFSGSTAAVGQTFTARIVISWQGSLLSTDFQVAFHYCPTPAPTNCVLLGSSTVTQNFFGSGTVTVVSPTLTVPPSALVGNGYVRFQIDATNAVTETNENNNNVYDQITITTPPDLTITAAQVPVTGSADGAGATFTARHTVQAGANRSAVETDFYLAHYLCPSPAPTGCTALGDNLVTADLASGGTTQVLSSTLTIPASTAPGTYYLRAFADSTGVVSEGSEANNNYYTQLTILGPSDLAVDQLVAPLTGSTAGAGSTFSARCRVRNLSGGTMTADIVLQYFYCTSATPAACTSLGTSTLIVDLPAGGSTTVTSPTLTMPTNARVGNGQIRFLVDATNLVSEANESNNDGYAPITVTALPDLSVQSSVVPLSGSVASAGATFTARYQIRNAASTSAFTTDFTVAVHFCPSNGPAGCALLGQTPMTTDFLSGQTNPLNTIQLSVPLSATPGTHYIRGVIDSGNAVAEGDETNNERYDPITVGSAAPDLLVKSFTATVTGSSVSYSAEVCNGGAATTKSLTLALTFDAATAPACGGSPDQLWTLTAGLAAGACETRSHTIPSVAPGSHTAWFFVDAACAVGESSESNNLASAPYTVTPPPDGGVKDGGKPDASPGDGRREAAPASDGAREAAVGSDAAWLWPDLGRPGDGGASWPKLDPGPPPAGAGCGCELGARPAPRSLALLGLVLVLVILRRRR